jgi:putative ABC transport system permease protein
MESPPLPETSTFNFKPLTLNYYPSPVMLRNYVVIALRNMMRNKLFITINVLGLGLAISFCIIAWLNWRFAEDWDKDHAEHAESIYRIQFWHDVPAKSERWGSTPMPIADHIRQNIKAVDKVVSFLPSDAQFRMNDEVFQTSLGYADSLFFDLFNFELIHGNQQDFKKSGTLFISDELARIYFGREDVTGELVAQIINGTPREFVVGGVFRKPPLNSSFFVSAFTLWENVKDIGVRTDDWRTLSTTFLQIKDPSFLQEVTQHLQQYVEPQNQAREDFKVKSYYLENFKGIARSGQQDPRIRGSHLRIAMPNAVVDMPLILSSLLLLLACFNFTNTSIAVCGQRLKEIGIRKTMGGVRRQLIFQFLGESLTLCFLGLVAGLIFAEFLVPAFDNLWTWMELDLNYADNLPFLLFLAGLLLFTALVAGGYAAFYVTSFEPIAILKEKTKFGGAGYLTRFLLGMQFAIAILTIIFAIGFYYNAKYQKAYDLGYYTSGVISVDVGNESGFNTYRDALAGNNDIIDIAGTKHHLLWAFTFTTVKHESQERQVDMMEVGDDYLKAMNIRLIAGREFNRDSETDRKESILVTEEFVKQFNWKAEDAVGKRVVWMDTTQLYVIGVVKDIYSRALFRPVEPMMLGYADRSEYSKVIVHAKAGKMLEINEFMAAQWKKVFPDRLYNGAFIDLKMKETLETNDNAIIVFKFIGYFALLMSATGLFTLVSLQILRRTKEIGVRKVLGASFLHIIRVISLEFMVIILIGCLAGGAAGYAMVNVTLDSAWEYYEKVTPLTFIISVSIIFLLAVITVGYKIIATAGMNPVKTLRTE